LFVSTIARAETPALWLYYATNLQSDKNVDELEQIWGRAAKAGYSHVLLTDSKFTRLGDLGDMTKPYMRNVNRVKQIAADLKLEIVPATLDNDAGIIGAAALSLESEFLPQKN
jgi:adhesin HecA-like repeat protein